jgi:hypothetical protein
MAALSSLKSTIVRSIFSTLERAAPDLGARWAERLWLTMPRFRGTHRTTGLPLAETFRVLVNNREVAGRAWGTGPTVYLVHGWGGASTQLDPFVAPLLATGHRVISFDALSHGDSDPGHLGPRRSTIPEMADALAAVVNEHGPAHAIIAHSLGSTAVFYALRHGLPAHRLVFLAPMTQPSPYTALFAAALGFDERIRTRMEARVAQRVGRPWSDFDIPSHVGAVGPLPALLLVHDPRDRETRYADSLAVQKVWPDAELITARDLGHWRILRDPMIVDHTVSFITPATEAINPTRIA